MTRRRLPIGIQTFRTIREEGCYYVDKTAYARRLVDEGKHYFLSRPRRFGKSLFVDTLKELFEGDEALFRGLAVHDHWDWSVRHPVLRLSFGGGHFREPAGLDAKRDGAARRGRAGGRRRVRLHHGAGAVRGPAGGAASARRPPHRRPGGRVRQAHPRRARRSRDRPRQPRLPARAIRGDQGRRRARAVHLSNRRQQVLEGESVLRPQQPHRHHPRAGLLGRLRLHRPRPRYGVRSRAGGGSTARPSATGTTATVGSGRSGSTTPSTSCCSFAAASSTRTGSRPARRRSWSRRCSSAG